MSDPERTQDARTEREKDIFAIAEAISHDQAFGPDTDLLVEDDFERMARVALDALAARASESTPQPGDALIEDGAKAIQRHFPGSWEEMGEARRNELRRRAADTFAAIERHRASESAPIAEQLAEALRALTVEIATEGRWSSVTRNRVYAALAAFDASTASPQEGDE